MGSILSSLYLRGIGGQVRISRKVGICRRKSSGRAARVFAGSAGGVCGWARCDALAAASPAALTNNAVGATVRAVLFGVAFGLARGVSLTFIAFIALAMSLQRQESVQAATAGEDWSAPD